MRLLTRRRLLWTIALGGLAATYVFGPSVIDGLSAPPDSVQHRCAPDPQAGRPDPLKAARPSGTIKIIRLTNAGEFVDRCELTDVLYDLNWDRPSLTRRPPVRPDAKPLPKLAVLYVHGWRHGADAGDSDRRDFADLIDKLRARYAGKKNVVAVYVGWNARPGFGVLDYLSFWSKKAIADRIAQSAVVTKIVSSIDATMDRSTETPDQFVAIGHSLGARILFSATEQSLIVDTEVAHPGYFTGHYRRVSGPADIVVLLNPAFEASMYTALNDFIRNEEFFRDDQLPLMITISTDDDWVTKTAFPIGQWLGAARSARETTTIGNYDAYVTHTLLPAKDGRCGRGPHARDPSEALLIDDLCLRRSERADGGIVQTHNPFVVVRTVPSVIKGHGGIWSPTFSTWLFDVLSALVTKRDVQKDTGDKGAQEN